MRKKSCNPMILHRNSSPPYKKKDREEKEREKKRKTKTKEKLWNKSSKWKEIKFQSNPWREIEDDLEALHLGLRKEDTIYLKEIIEDDLEALHLGLRKEDTRQLKEIISHCTTR